MSITSSLIVHSAGRWAVVLRQELVNFRAWMHSGFTSKAPSFVKRAVLSRYEIPGATWVETGTFLGATTQWFASRSPRVHTIEPESELYRIARKKFAHTNVRTYHGTSEEMLPVVLRRCDADVNFWLDGHYSGGLTYQADFDCPVETELNLIGESLARLGNVVIFVDDVRCFTNFERPSQSYPPLSNLIDWANNHGFDWIIESDILVLSAKPPNSDGGSEK